LSLHSSPGALALLERYDAFCFDVWGVLFDGDGPVPHARRFVEQVKARGKLALVFSNTPSTSQRLLLELLQLGYDRECFSSVSSAGSDFLARAARPGAFGLRSDASYCYWGPSERRATLAETSFRAASDPEQADFVVLAGPEEGQLDMRHYAHALRAPARVGKPAFCINPDFSTIGKSGQLVHCGGYVAEIYRALGGTVHYFGKPNTAFYATPLAAHGVARARTLIIGDDISTDIYAGNLLGIDTLLLKQGLSRRLIDVAGESSLVDYCRYRNVSPTYVAEDLN
jgi:HAD superfamily hydrolase (TIGR01459 family)